MTFGSTEKLDQTSAVQNPIIKKLRFEEVDEKILEDLPLELCEVFQATVQDLRDGGCFLELRNMKKKP